LVEEVLRSDGEVLRRHARRHAESDTDAEDALADACVSFLRAYPGAPGEDAARYMMTVVRHAAWEIRRRRRLTAERELEASRPLDATDVADVSHLLIPADGELNALLSAIDAEERKALLLLGLGYANDEIAAICRWSPRKARRRISTGRRRLRQLVEMRSTAEDGGQDGRAKPL
jgi:RNA polymerase sigma factor (sigma-70 family)